MERLRELLTRYQEVNGLPPRCVLTIRNDRIQSVYEGYDEVKKLATGKYLQSAQNCRCMKVVHDVGIAFMAE